MLVEASLLLALARVALLILPFRRIAAHLGAFLPPIAEPAHLHISPQQVALAREIGWAVTRAARYLPFRAVCLPQAIAARQMLARRGIKSILHFGAAKGTDPAMPIEAHAWLDAVGIEVTGYPVAHEFNEIARFI